MEFSSLRIKYVDYVVLHRSVMKRWEAKNRSNYIVGILLEGSASHDFGYQNFVIKRNCIYFLNQRDDYTEKSCLETALEQIGLTARRFGELFRNSFDITPNKYITLKKINYAKSLLETNAFSVTDAAQQSGFSDIYYFSKVFKKILMIY